MSTLSDDIWDCIVSTYYRAAEIVSKQKPDATFPFPKVEYKNMGKKAGEAASRGYMAKKYGADVPRIRLNHILLRENVETFKTRTIPHEFAHIIVYTLWPKAKGHGVEWKWACKELGMEDITRCHSYDTSSSKRNITRFKIVCQCRSFVVTLRWWNKHTKYGKPRCKHCHNSFSRV